MKGISNVIALSAMLVITMALVALVLPWAWNATTQVIDVMGRASLARSMEILSAVVFYPPAVVPPPGKDEVLLIANIGDTTMTGIKVVAIRPDLTQIELNFYIIRIDGEITPWGTFQDYFSPGDVIVARVPNDTNYLGYQFVLQSREYSEAYLVGG